MPSTRLTVNFNVPKAALTKAARDAGLNENATREFVEHAKPCELLMSVDAESGACRVIEVNRHPVASLGF